MDHGKVDPGFAATRIVFVVFAEPSVTTQPGERPFDNPPLRQNNEAVEVNRLEDGSQQPMAAALHPRGDSSISAIGPNDAQPWQSSPNHIQQRLGRIAILHVGGEHQQGPDQAQGIDEQVTLAARAFFAAS